MESLQDKIASLEATIESNKEKASAITAKAKEDSAEFLKQNRELAKVITKLKETEATINSIFAETTQKEEIAVPSAEDIAESPFDPAIPA